MVVADFYLIGIAVFEPKADPPLIVDSDRVLALAVIEQGMQAIAGRNP